MRLKIRDRRADFRQAKMGDGGTNLVRQKDEISVQPSTCASDRLYTIDDAARMLHLKSTWLYERTRKNAIPHHRFGKYIRFTETDLDEIIAMASQPASSSGVS